MKVLKCFGFMLALATLGGQAHADTYWGNFSFYGCWEGKPGYAKYAAVLYDIPWGQSWEDHCNNKSAYVQGYSFDRPTACVNHHTAMWGEFAVPYAGC
jgi:hypothetical protein